MPGSLYLRNAGNATGITPALGDGDTFTAANFVGATTALRNNGATSTFWADATARLWYRFACPTTAQNLVRVNTDPSKVQSYRFRINIAAASGGSRVVVQGLSASATIWRALFNSNTNQFSVQLASSPYTIYGTTTIAGGITLGTDYDLTIDITVGSGTADGVWSLKVSDAGTDNVLSGGSISGSTANWGSAVLTRLDLGSNDTASVALDYRITDVQWMSDRSSSLPPITQGAYYTPGSVALKALGTTAASSSGTSLTVSTPAGWVQGDALIAFLGAQASFTSDWDAVSNGWTRIGPAFVANDGNQRMSGMYVRFPTSAPPSTYAFATGTSAGRLVGVIGLFSGIDPNSPTVGSSSIRNTGNATPVLPKGTLASGYQLEMSWAQFASPNSYAIGGNTLGLPMYLVDGVSPSGTENTSVSRSAYRMWAGNYPGTVPDSTVTFLGTTAANIVGAATLRALVSVAFTGASTMSTTGTSTQPGGTTMTMSGSSTVDVAATTSPPVPIASTSTVFIWAPGYASIAEMIAQPTFYVAHRGGSYSYPEMSLFAYRSAASRGYPALELSLARTSDGVWFGLHDASLDRTSLGTGGGSGTNLVASSMTWAQVQQYSILGSNAAGNPSQAAQPYMRLEEYLAAFYRSHITFIDPKAAYAFRAELLNILDALPGNPRDRIVGKYYGVEGGTGNTGWAKDLANRGYQSWGYFYESDQSNYATYAPRWTMLGQDTGASQSAWDALAAAGPGRPLIGHIPTSEAAATNGRTKASQAFVDNNTANAGQGLMVAGAGVVTPAAVNRLPITTTPTIVGASTLTVTATNTTTAAVPLSGTSTMDAAAANTTPGTVAMVGGSTIAMPAAVTPTAATPLVGTSTLGVGAVQTVAPPTPATFSDDFNRADGALGSNWVTTSGTPMVVSANAVASASGSTGANAARWATDPGSGAIFSQVTYRGGNTVGVAVAMPTYASGSNNNTPTWYLFRHESAAAGTTLLQKNAGAGSHTNLVGSNGPAAVAGDIMRVEWDGATLTGFLNGVQVLRVVPATPIAPTQRAVGFAYGTTTAGVTLLDNWSGGAIRGSVDLTQGSTFGTSASSGTTQTAAVALVGTSTLTASGTDTTQAPVALVGTGALGVSGSGTATTTVALAQSSTVTTTAAVTAATTLPLTQVGALAVAPGGTTAAPVPFASTSTVAVAPGRTAAAAVSLTSTSTLGTGGTVVAAAAVVLASMSTATVTAARTTPATVTMPGVGTVTVASTTYGTNVVPIAGTGTLAVVGAQTTATTITLTAASTVTVGATVAHPVIVALVGSSSVTVTTTTSGSAAVAIVGSSTVSTTGTDTIPAAVTVVSSSSLAYAVTVTHPAAVAVVSTSTFATGSTGATTGVVPLPSTSALLIGTNTTHPAVVAILDGSTLTVTATGIGSATVPYASTSTVTVTPERSVLVDVRFVAASAVAITGTAYAVRTATVTAVSTSTIAVTATRGHAALVDIVGSSTATVAAVISEPGTADFGSVSMLSVAAAVVRMVLAEFESMSTINITAYSGPPIPYRDVDITATITDRTWSAALVPRSWDGSIA